jgi:CBS domain-containing protein
MVDGHYLNLPVVENDGRLVGIVDVLKLTYATLEQVSQIPHSIGKTADPRSTR